MTTREGNEDEFAACYTNFENDETNVPPLPRPQRFDYRRGISDTHIFRTGDLDEASNLSLPVHISSPSGYHRRGVSHFSYRHIETDPFGDTGSMYLNASERRREMHPDIYHHHAPQPRSSVLKLLFSPRAKDNTDCEQTFSKLYTMLDPKSKTWYSEIFKKFITTVILCDLVSFILSTEVDLFERYWLVFSSIEASTACAFLAEYISRISVCTENKKFGMHGPIMGRLRWMCTFHAIIDALATAPFFIFLLTGVHMPNMTYLRIFRVLRILKTDSYARAFNACYRVLHFNREILSVGVLICFFLVITTSLLLYYFRPRNGEAEDLPFQSIPSTLYLSVLILTGQDSFIRSHEDMPWYTKTVVGLTGALSVTMYAIPISLLTWGFEAEAERCARKTRESIKQAKSSNNMEELGKVVSTNSDEEYLKIIANDTSSVSELGGRRRADVNTLVAEYMRDDHDGRKYESLAHFLTTNGYYRPMSTFMERDISGSSPKEVSQLKERIGDLESSLQSVHTQMDTLCKLLEKSQNDR